MQNRKDFLNEVIGQIASKEAKQYVSKELDYHVREAKQAWVKKGLSEEEAEARAIAQMGSPIQLGQQLNKIHRPKVDWLMVMLLGATFFLGFLPLFVLDGVDAARKAVMVLIGGAAAWGIMLIDYRKWQKHGWLFYGAGVLLLLFIQFGPNRLINGVPIVKIGPLTIESLMVLPFFFLAWASFFHSRKFKVWQFLLLFAFSCFLFMRIPSVSALYIYGVMAAVMFWWSKWSVKVKAAVTGAGIGLIAVYAVAAWPFLHPYQKERIIGFLNPEKYSSNYTVLYVKELMASAGWFGGSVGEKAIPDAHTNFVFVSFTYHYGWGLALILVCVLALLAARIVIVSRNIRDSYGRLLLVGASAVYTVQLVSNIAMAFGLFPPTTMSLPFISYGLMPILLNSVLMGVVLSVYRRKDLIVRSVT
jgi:cell division protein FtsW (lipid II flippase)